MHPLMKIVDRQKVGISAGIGSICSANELVIEAALEKGMEKNTYVLIEATANQVNQFGGYTGMKPADFREFVYFIADKVKIPKEMIILGGDHLGPLIWKEENESDAMEKAKELIRLFVASGFTKIHLDTSMHLGGDDKTKVLDTKIISDRGASLCKVAEETYLEQYKTSTSAIPPVYVVGSEVPVPGGAREEEEGLKVTDVKDLEDTIETFKRSFVETGIEKAWDSVIAIVVQPGVEFGDDSVHAYNKEAASDLSNTLKKYPNLVFEGHSTDYQLPEKLKQMVEDGIAILKVGPALTYTLREAFFVMHYIEKELLNDHSDLINVLDQEMVKDPTQWIKYYHGNHKELRLKRKYSYSDRSRYYLPNPQVVKAIEKMICNLKMVTIPLTILNQFMPDQYNNIRCGRLTNDPVEIIKDRVKLLLDDYYYAVSD